MYSYLIRTSVASSSSPSSDSRRACSFARENKPSFASAVRPEPPVPRAGGASDVKVFPERTRRRPVVRHLHVVHVRQRGFALGGQEAPLAQLPDARVVVLVVVQQTVVAQFLLQLALAALHRAHHLRQRAHPLLVNRHQLPDVPL